MKKLPFATLKIMVTCMLWGACISGARAQHDLSLMVGMDYGIPVNAYAQNKAVLKGTVPSRQFNLNAGIQYRVFNFLGIEAGIGQSIRTMRMIDNRFANETGNHNTIIKSKNHYLTTYLGLQGFVPLADEDFLVVGGGMMWNNAGSATLEASTTYIKGDETVSIDNAYLGRNHAFLGEIGYLGSKAGRSTLYLGAKVNIGSGALMQGRYTAANNLTGAAYADAVTDKGSYIGLDIKYYLNVLHRDKVARDHSSKRPHRSKKPVETVTHVPKPVEPTIQVAGRDIKIDDNIKAMSPEITVNVWDSQAQDGDTVSVYLNGEVLLSNVALKNEKLQFKAQLQPGKNYLVLYAHNLGKYPPNTAAITVDDGVKQHQIVMESTLKTSGSVEITLGQ
jgi:hypothetical protein